MDDLTKKKLEKAGKIFLGIAEAGASSMQSTAKTYSKNKNFSEDYREKYAEMADGFGNIKNMLHDYKERIGQSKGQTDYYDEYEDDDYGDESCTKNQELMMEQHTIHIPKCYDNIEKAHEQKKVHY